MRLFFALWPARALQVSLAEMTHGVVVAAGGRAVPPENFHVTLAFLGSVPETRISQVEVVAQEVADEVAGAPVQVSFDEIEYWKKAKILCATCRSAASASAASGEALPANACTASAEVLAGSAGSSSAEALARALKSRLTAAGFAPDLKPFRAHVTLARKVPHGTLDRSMQSVPWTCGDFALVESRTGPRGSLYSVLNSWLLCTEVRKMPEKMHK